MRLRGAYSSPFARVGGLFETTSCYSKDHSLAVAPGVAHAHDINSEPLYGGVGSNRSADSS